MIYFGKNNKTIWKKTSNTHYILHE